MAEAESEEERLPPGSRLGPYEIVSRTGKGAMSVVYEARHTYTNEHRALKVCSLSAPEEARNALQWEAEVGSILGKHPNVLSVHELGGDDDWMYLSMDFMQGRSLDDFVYEHRSVPHDKALSIARDVANGLEHMHGKGIIHRDVKPSNIFYDGSKALLFDFGIAYDSNRQIPKDPKGKFMGTLNYAPPEYFMGRKPHAKGDIFSLGVSIYHMLVKAPPLEEEDDYYVDEMFDRLNRIFSARPEPFSKVCLKSVERFPFNRYQSAKEFAEALDDALRKL